MLQGTQPEYFNVSKSSCCKWKKTGIAGGMQWLQLFHWRLAHKCPFKCVSVSICVVDLIMLVKSIQLQEEESCEKTFSKLLGLDLFVICLISKDTKAQIHLENWSCQLRSYESEHVYQTNWGMHAVMIWYVKLMCNFWCLCKPGTSHKIALRMSPRMWIHVCGPLCATISISIS
jgi:hypothetical protein